LRVHSRARPFCLDLREAGVADPLRGERLERPIGVVDGPRTERVSHDVSCRLSRQLDTMIHMEETSAITPQDRPEGWHRGEVQEAFPAGV
jgi:erythromycin esterase-like protein